MWSRWHNDEEIESLWSVKSGVAVLKKKESLIVLLCFREPVLMLARSDNPNVD